MKKTRQPILLAAILALCLVLDANAGTVYKVVGKDGKVTYTDKAPDEGEQAEVTPIEADPNVNVMETPPELQKKIVENQEKREEQKKEYAQQYDAWQEELEAAEAAVKEAEEALKRGQEAQDGDFISYRSPTGAARAHPSAAYLERVEQLEKALKNARERLAEIRRQKPAQ